MRNSQGIYVWVQIFFLQTIISLSFFLLYSKMSDAGFLFKLIYKTFFEFKIFYTYEKTSVNS